MIRYAQSFVNGLYESKDVVGLYQVIGVVAQRRQLPEQFWLFRQLLAWASSTRSGVWQYYEAISKQNFDAVASSLQKFGLVDWAERYRREWRLQNRQNAAKNWTGGLMCTGSSWRTPCCT
jgi:hypothetical protein